MRHLIAGNVDQRFLEEIGALSHLERLEFEWPFVAKDLTPLLGLEKLRFLSIDSPRHISDFAPLLRLPSLRMLFLTNPAKMADLEWLRDAHHLEVVGIEGGTLCPFRIPGLRPLAGLRSLRAFFAVSTRLADEDLSPLADCAHLEYLGIAAVAPPAEFERLKAAKPMLLCDWFRPAMWEALQSSR